MEDSISGIVFSDESYVLKQKAVRTVRNSYILCDSDENEVLGARQNQKLLEVREDFRFKHPEGNEVFRAKGQDILDIAGDYALIDSNTGEKFAVLKKNFTLLTHSWKIQSSSKETLATVVSRNRPFGLLSSLNKLMYRTGVFWPNLSSLIPQNYNIEDPEGRQIGCINRRSSLRDRYHVRVEGHPGRRTTIIGAVALICALG